MCGILGTLPAIPDGLLRRSLNRLAHRGPDGEGVWHEEQQRISLGHRRLAIFDLSAEGAQPMHYMDLAIVFNGEVYNHPELRQTLQQKGHRFATQTDTEVLMAAYKEWGADCLQQFNGMWALAIWDKTKHELFLSRDRFGKKPLYYMQQNGQLFFASEMKALLPLMDNPQPNKDFTQMVAQYDSYEASGQCLVQGVHSLPAGHYAVYKDGKLTQHRYWDTLEHLVTPPNKYEEQVEQYRELLLDATRLRLRADVGVACALSGGVDSSSVMAAIMENIHQYGQGHFNSSYTATFPGTKLDETVYAKEVLSYFNAQGNFVPIDGQIALDNLADDLYYFEEVYRTPPSPMMQLYKQYREDGNYVSLDGHGPDELLSGYGNFMFMAFLDTSPLQFKEVMNITDTYKAMYPVKDSFLKLRPGGYFQYLKTQVWYQLQQSKPQLPQTLQDLVQHKEAIAHMGHFNYGLYQLFHYSIFPTLLRNYDRYSMRSGVEMRMPFVDHRLVAYSYSIPWQSKLNRVFNKTILRDAVAPILDKSIAYRRTKIGFTSPLPQWFNGPWRQWLDDTIHSTDFKNCNLVNHPAATAAYNRFRRKAQPTVIDGEELWLQLSPYLWQEHFFKRATQPH